MTNAKLPYRKPWLPIADQVQKLRDRGLVIADAAKAERILRYANYYRFTGFCLRFQYFDKNTNDRRFISGTTIEDIVSISAFDARLRDSYSEALEMVELSLRSAIAFHFGKAHGAFGHLDPANFVKSFSRPIPCKGNRSRIVNPYKEWRNALHEETCRSNELFVTHFRKTYAEYPDLPIWMVSELCSFGTLSRMFSHLRNVEQGMVARDYGLQFVTMQSWLHTMTYVRNICAHHARLWDKTLNIAPQIPGGKNWMKSTVPQRSVAFVALMLNWMLAHDSVDPVAHKKWRGKMEEMVDAFIDRFPRLVPYSGFTVDWKKNPLWWQV